MLQKCNKLSGAMLSQSTKNKTDAEYFLNEYESLLSNKFLTSPMACVVEREDPYASNNFIDCNIRISSVTTKIYGFTFSDDYKSVSYSSIYEMYPLGTHYRFDNNIWMIYNPDMLKTTGTSAIIRRCNNVLRWIDRDTGKLIEQPCILDNTIWGNTDSNDMYIKKPKGYIKIYVQKNENTVKIKPNFRFMFGNKHFWNVFKIAGGGVDNILNSSTYDSDGPSIINFTAFVDYVDDARDDVVKGIADVNGYAEEKEEPVISDVFLEPNVDSVREGSSTIFTVKKYVNGELSDTNFTITMSTEVPKKYFNYENLGSNKFSIENKSLYLTHPILISATDGTDTMDFVIWLGGW